MSIWNRLFKSREEIQSNQDADVAEATSLGNFNPYLRDQVAELTAQVQQLAFLLDCAPMIDMFPLQDRERLKAVRSAYAYIHPKTLGPFTWGAPPSRYYKFPGSPTIWIPMSSMPEGRVIFSPLQVPGIGKLLSE